jgi:hypothetical protein
LDVVVATLAGEVTLQVTSQSNTAVGITIGDVKDSYTKTHGVPRGSQKIYLSSETTQASGEPGGGGFGGIDDDDDTDFGKVLPDSMPVSTIPADGLLFMVAASWQVRVDYENTFECGDPCSRSPGDEGYDVEMAAVQKQLATERSYDKSPGEEGYMLEGEVWHEDDPECKDWEDEAMGMSKLTRWTNENCDEHSVAIVHNYAVDKAAGLQWADRCLNAVRTLCQGAAAAGDGSREELELHIHPGCFGQLTRETAQDFKSNLTWGPKSLECVQVIVEAQMRGTLRVVNDVANVASRPFVSKSDTCAEASGGAQMLPKDIQLARRLRQERF